MDPVRMRQLTVPGEFFWFEMPLYKFNYIIHIYLSIIGGIFSGAQFVPAIRRNYVLLHRLNGYLVLITVFVANVTGGIVARRSFGGELNSQAVYYVTAIMSNFSLLWAISNVKRNTRIHRRWMMRKFADSRFVLHVTYATSGGVVYFSVVISARVIGLAAQAIVTDIGSYYSLWRCDEVLFVLKDIPTLLLSYPQCSNSTSNLTNPTLYVPVHASDNEGKLGHASAVRATQGMVIWIATLIHVAGCEIYLRSTEEANSQRYGYALEHKDFDPDRDMNAVNY
ncbi:hypothetical protein L218DRAFT_543957 [Marasmius fiardii PR-910]|nr:hypothetical protein L218DRAFT_543957 [Marasmius fiardii PR-910]